MFWSGLSTPEQSNKSPVAALSVEVGPSLRAKKLESQYTTFSA